MPSSSTRIPEDMPPARRSRRRGSNYDRTRTPPSRKNAGSRIVANSSRFLVASLVLLFAIETDAWMAPNRALSARSLAAATTKKGGVDDLRSVTGSPLTARRRRRSRSNPSSSSSSSLCATLEEHKSEEDQSSSSNSSSLPPRRTRRIDDILNEYEETGDAGLTISILESSLKREQERSSTLAVRLAYADKVIAEQKKRLEFERSSLQKKAQALSETQRKLRELEERLLQQPPTTATPRSQLPPPPADPQAPWQQPPLTSSERQYPLITNWSINRSTGEITGSVSCHPSIPDGTTIVTSGLNPESFARAGDDYVYASNQPATVVTTLSGSMYQLGVKKVRIQSQAPPVPQTPTVSKQQQQQAQRLNDQYPDLEYPLTGQSISNGRGIRYMLAGTPKRKPSGRAEITLAYKCDDLICDTQTVYVMKLSTNKDKLRREHENYGRVQEHTVDASKKSNGWIGGALSSMFEQQQSGPDEDAFVGCYDFLPICEGSIKYAQHSAIVLEKGHEDLRVFEHGLQTDGDPVRTSMDPALVRASLRAAARCLRMLHDRCRLVWTDLKAENLIFMEPQGTETPPGSIAPIRGIDLESAIPHRGNPLDYTPEACPPEFARYHRKGNPYDFALDYSYDVWSFGMLAYELATGRGYFKGKTPAEIMTILGDPGFEPPLSSSSSGGGGGDDASSSVVGDPALEDLIRSCLRVDPRQRISVAGILKHPYLLEEQPRAGGNGGDAAAGGAFGRSGGNGAFW